MKDDAAGAKKLFSVGGNESVLLTRSRVRATAAATIEPMGAREGAGARREHLIKVVVELNQADAQHADKAEVTATTRRALGAYAPKAGEPDHRESREVSTTRRSKTGVISHYHWGRPRKLAMIGWEAAQADARAAA